MLDKWYKKEKPVFTGIVRGMGGFGFGAGSASAASSDPGDSGVVASGGFISDFTEGSDHYRAHIFVDRGPNNFVVHSTPGDAITMDYLVVAGGGGGSRYGAGGAGGLRSTVDQTGGGGSLESAVPISTGTYTITVGTGGRGNWGEGPNGDIGTSGSDSSIAGPTFSTVTSTGGGYGGTNASSGTPNTNGGPGGSGGGSDYSPPSIGGSGTANQGYGGGEGTGGPPWLGGGGGGAGGVGSDSTPNVGGAGGTGVQVLGIAGPSSSQPSWGAVPEPDARGGGAPAHPSPLGGLFAGGGGGATNTPGYTGGYGGFGGGGQGIGLNTFDGTQPWGHPTHGQRGVDGTGGGGGGGRHGGSGIVVLRYQMPSPVAPKSKATGGIVTAYDPTSPSPMAGKTVHVFNEPGTFTTNPGSPFNIEYLLIGGGGGGSSQVAFSDAGAGGGAGGVRCNTPEAPSPQKMPAYNCGANTQFTVQVGKGGEGAYNSNNINAPQYMSVGQAGENSNFYPTPVSYPSTEYIRAVGGGRGGGYTQNSNSYREGGPGGSGGGSGGGSSGTSGGSAASDDPSFPGIPQGNAGGNCGPNYQAGGGGGYTEGGSGGTGGSPFGGRGGNGFNCSITGVSRGVGGGGGAGGMDPARSPQYNGRPAPDHGGGDGGSPAPNSQITTYYGEPGVMCTGGGGGGGCGSSTSAQTTWNSNPGLHQVGGVGAPGIVVIAYTTP